MNFFDASAVLAVLNDEPGAQAVLALFGEGEGEGDVVISAANPGEEIANLIDRFVTEADAIEAWNHLPLTVAPLTRAVASAAELLRKDTRALGLSLGDRCCLALGRAKDAKIITADKAWKPLKGFRISLIH